MKMLKTKDNNNGTFLVKDANDIQNLISISGESIEDLIKRNKKLLIFPQEINKYHDDIHKNSVFSLSGNMLRTHNIMGFIGINDTYLSIASRFDNSKGDYFLHYMLQKVLSLNIFDYKFKTGSEAIWDFLLYLFPYYLNKALKQGLFKTYIRNNYNNANVKGAIDIKKHIRANVPFSGDITYIMREHSFDNSVTQLIRHTIEYIKTNPLGCSILSSGSETIENAKIIQENTPQYNKGNRANIVAINNKPLNHPYFTGYKELQKICLQILRHEKLTFGAEKDEVYGLLFDGSCLWEEYLNIVFIENGVGLKHPENRTKKGGDNLFTDGQSIYPDFIKRKIDHKTAYYVADAKYKHIDNRDDNVSREDYYQLITYMYRYECSTGYLFFPCDKGDKNYNQTREIDGITDNRKIIELGLKVPEVQPLFKEFIKSIKVNEKILCGSILM